MKNPCKQALIAAAMAVAVAVPQLASAETTTAIRVGVAPISADARVDFRVVIPGVLRFRVGSAAGIDLIDFAPTPANLGTGTDVAASTGSGDQGNGAVTVDILSNSGQVTINHDTDGAVLSDGLGNTIPYTEILTASNDVANLDAPALGTLTSTQPTLTGSLTNESATWTYTYDNTFAYNSGIYGGVGINGGRVTYTASSP
jgi:hypothetical protein